MKRSNFYVLIGVGVGVDNNNNNNFFTNFII